GPRHAYEWRCAGQEPGGGCVDGIDVSADVRAVACRAFVRARGGQATVAGSQVVEIHVCEGCGKEVPRGIAGAVVRLPRQDVVVEDRIRDVLRQRRKIDIGTDDDQ